ncbi:Putative parathyroid hormone 2 receptor [Trichuris trichiura]|uniref:Putative parathyroid hormone 2 receptor n=1 Tax=Trichuris trichiura TaxID=36087 RepID=A0A077Z0Y8_TRITR|nr:Putative parathyroid hormone 2 receptor [Trichuris trichiura]
MLGEKEKLLKHEEWLLPSSKTDDGLASMRAIRKKQEKLMNLHLTLAQEEMTESILEDKLRKKIQENSKLLMDEFAELVEMIDEFNSRRRNSEASRQLGLDDLVQPGYDQNPDATSF